MASPQHFLVLGATGGTGIQFVPLALASGHKIRALVRTPSKFPTTMTSNANLEVIQGSTTDANLDTDSLCSGGITAVICMLGDVNAQRTTKINTAFVQKLVPSMRKHGVKRFLYQAGGFSRPYGGSLSPIVWTLRHTLARGYAGQHEDNEAVNEYLATEANDLEWIVHRAAINPNATGSKGVLVRAEGDWAVPGIGTFEDCAAYTLKLVGDEKAIRTCSLSSYQK